MAYPSTIDSFITKQDGVTDVMAADVNDLQTSVVSLQTKVGVDSSAVNTSHDYKLSDVTTGNKAESSVNKETSALDTSTTKYPCNNVVKAYVDSMVAGLLDYRGGYNASGNVFPSSGGSGAAGAILKGDMYIISVAGSLGGIAVQIGDSLIASVDTPGQTSSNWNVLNSNISYVPEDVANKVTSLSGASTDVQYPSAKLVYDLLALKAPLASPTFTGTPSLPTGTTATTQSANDNSTKLATTAYADTVATHSLQSATTVVNVSSATAPSTGQVLTATSSTAATWQTPSAGGNPTGVILMWGTTTAPTGYLLADGAAVSRTTYSALFAVIGTTFGVGDNSTTFNIPDFKGRVAVGKSTDTEFDVLGETGGEKTHVLTVGELATHSHPAAGNTGGGSLAFTQFTNGVSSVNTGSAGSNTPHNNLQPYITINYIIKT